MKDWTANELLVLPEPKSIDISEYKEMSLDQMAKEYAICETGGCHLSEASRFSKVYVVGVEIHLNDMNTVSFEKEDKKAFKLDAYIQVAEDALDLIIWDKEAESILGVSFSEFAALTEDKQCEIIEQLSEKEYSVYVETKVNDFQGKKSLRSYVRKIEIDD